VTLPKPDHLQPADDESGRDVDREAQGGGSRRGVLGVLSFLVVAIGQRDWDTPDWRLSVPGFLLTAIASGASLARREPQGYWGVGAGGSASPRRRSCCRGSSCSPSSSRAPRC
jgi:hypothetical protein